MRGDVNQYVNEHFQILYDEQPKFLSKQLEIGSTLVVIREKDLSYLSTLKSSISKISVDPPGIGP